MAFAASGLLTAAGVWLGERGRRSQASLATVGTGIAGLYLSLLAASAAYDLVPLAVAFPAALGIGSLATAVAVRWDSQSLAGLGILGALAAPILVGESAAGARLRWEWLRIAAFFVAVPQIVVWALDQSGWDGGSGPRGRLLLVLALAMAIELVAARGFEVRAGRATLRASTASGSPSPRRGSAASPSSRRGFPRCASARSSARNSTARPSSETCSYQSSPRTVSATRGSCRRFRCLGESAPMERVKRSPSQSYQQAVVTGAPAGSTVPTTAARGSRRNASSSGGSGVRGTLGG